MEKRVYEGSAGYHFIANYNRDCAGLCIEFKSPTNNYQISTAQKEMKSRYKQSGYRFRISNDYNDLISYLNKHMMGVRILCRYCSNQFHSKETYKKHLRSFYKK